MFFLLSVRLHYHKENICEILTAFLSRYKKTERSKRCTLFRVLIVNVTMDRLPASEHL